MNWTINPANGAKLVNTTTVSNSQGSASTNVTLGQTAGTITVTASFGTSTAVFTLTNQVVVSGISLSTGGSQTAVAGQAFAQPVVFLAHDANDNPVAGATVTFSASNGATVNPATGITNAQGMVSTTVTAGSAVGSIVVTATLGSFSATAALTCKRRGRPSPHPASSIQRPGRSDWLPADSGPFSEMALHPMCKGSSPG